MFSRCSSDWSMQARMQGSRAEINFLKITTYLKNNLTSWWSRMEQFASIFLVESLTTLWKLSSRFSSARKSQTCQWIFPDRLSATCHKNFAYNLRCRIASFRTVNGVDQFFPNYQFLFSIIASMSQSFKVPDGVGTLGEGIKLKVNLRSLIYCQLGS